MLSVWEQGARKPGMIKSPLAKQARQSRLFRLHAGEGEESPDSIGQGDG
jgi:hypothetical protein